MAAKSSSKATPQQTGPRLRARFANLPVPPDEIRCLWAKARNEATKNTAMSDESAALWTILLMESPEWHEHVEPVLTAIDEKRRADFLYSSRELESVFLFSFLKKGVTIRDSRDKLAGDRKKARELLGFDMPRNPKWRLALMERLDGVPSEATLSRHLARFDEKRRLEAYQAAGLAARDRHLTYDDFIEELLLLCADGTKIEVAGIAPHVNKKTGVIENENRATVWDAGYVSPKNAPPDHSGAGWNHISITTLGRIPVVLPRVVQLQKGESTTLTKKIQEQLATEISPWIGDRIGVLATDGGFYSPHVSHAAREAGYLINNHHSSHNIEDKRTRDSVEKKDKTKYSIYGYPNWHANGHREVFCKCGHRATKKNRKKNGILSIRVEGACAKCGTISIKCGDRFFSKGFRLVPNQTMPIGKRDYALGNGLTYNDPVSRIYGRLRRAHGEGYNSMLAENFGFNQGKKRYRRKIQAETAATIAFFAIHIKAMDERDREAATAQNLAPPALAA